MIAGIDRSGLSDAKARWAEIQADLAGDPRRTETVRLALAMWRSAQAAYDAAYGSDSDGVADNKATLAAGMWASQYVAQFEHFRKSQLGGAPNADAIAKLEAVDSWLASKRWHGMPRFAFAPGRETPLPRTMAGVHTDMLRYRESALRIREMLESAAKSAARKSA